MTTFAKNSLGAKTLFNERKFYQEFIDEYQTDKTKFIDLWYDHPFYGRVDKKGQVIYPSKAFLKPIGEKHGKEIYALNFVADMFNDMVEYWNSLQSAQKLHRKTDLLVIRPRKAWEDINESYHEYMNIVFSAFKKRIGKKYNIRKFDDMVNLIESFIESDSRFGVITKSTFVKSKYSSPLVSGLMIEILNYKQDDDTQKHKFLNDNNFLMFKLVAQKFNFKIDKNCPWRLIADIDSPNINPYLEKYNLKRDNIFKELYYNTYENDVENLKVYLLSFWNQLNEEQAICGLKQNDAVRIQR